VGATDLAFTDSSVRLSPSRPNCRLVARRGKRVTRFLAPCDTSDCSQGITWRERAEMADPMTGQSGFEVYRGKGRHARRIGAASGGLFFNIFMAWLRGRV